MKKLLRKLNGNVGSYGGSSSIPLNINDLHVIVCTIEKANSLLNRMSIPNSFETKNINNNLLIDFSLIVVDEAHMIGDPSRGPLLETILAKILLFNSKKEHKIQILCMSAVLSNPKMLASWLDSLLYINDTRPVPLNKFLMAGNNIYEVNESNNLSDPVQFIHFHSCFPANDPDGVLCLCRQSINNGGNVLIFCPTRQWVVNLAMTIAFERSEWFNNQAPLFNMNSQYIDNQLLSCFQHGVGFHHAGMTSDERSFVEHAFKRLNFILINLFDSISFKINILISTSTLSSGVNLPARRVIIRTLVWNGKPLDISLI